MRKRWPTFVAILCVVLSGMSFQPVAQAVYRLVRGAAVSVPVMSAYGWLSADSEHFRLYYQLVEAPVADDLLVDLEQSWEALAERWSTVSLRRVEVFLYSSQEELQQALGGVGSATLGAYRLGRLHLLSPLAWRPDLTPAAASAFYRQNGPVLHELVHLVLDYRVDGNAPVWFSEGLAQYWEWKVKGYRWAEAGRDWRADAVSLAELQAGFARMDEYTAYRQSLAVVEYLSAVHGPDALESIVQRLGEGETFAEAVQSGLGVGLQELESGWRAAVLP